MTTDYSKKIINGYEYEWVHRTYSRSCGCSCKKIYYYTFTTSNPPIDQNYFDVKYCAIHDSIINQMRGKYQDQIELERMLNKDTNAKLLLVQLKADILRYTLYFLPSTVDLTTNETVIDSTWYTSVIAVNSQLERKKIEDKEFALKREQEKLREEEEYRQTQERIREKSEKEKADAKKAEKEAELFRQEIKNLDKDKLRQEREEKARIVREEYERQKEEAELQKQLEIQRYRELVEQQELARQEELVKKNACIIS